MNSIHPVQGGNNRRRSIVHVGSVDEGCTGIQEGQAVAIGPRQDALHQLRIAGTPHNVWPDGGNPEARRIRGQGKQLCFRLGA
jgi:hypothetical protein